ncbi:MAG: glucose-6-phosphate isomerase [Sporomusaceae bacterium]|nr:glucose-6-phosphate isomerase [Sporomusaceae bacterium]
MMHRLTLTSGFTFDYTNLFGEGKVTTADLQSLTARLGKAHEAVTRMRSSGVVSGHLSKDGAPEPVLFSQLPYVSEGNLNNPASIRRLQQFGQSLRQRVDAVVSFGIGGSYLGNKVLFDIHAGEFWNAKPAAERDGYPELYFSGNNIDPQRTADLIDCLERKAAAKQGPYSVVLIVISKSGSTLDTMASFMVVYDALRQAGFSVEVVAVTDPAGGDQRTLLKKLADEAGWRTFSVPDGIGGRFSIFSEVGLITAACIGFDIDAFLAGARAMDQACLESDPLHNPAMLNAALKYLAAERYGCDIEIFMPYGDYLKSVAEWYVQLLAESLGKRSDRDGSLVYYGRTPVVAVGTTDMHAQTQQHQDGRRNKVVQFVQVAAWPVDPVIPDAFPSAASLTAVAGLTMRQALDAALAANAQALAADGRFNAAFILPQLSPYHLGELLYLLALSVAYEGELANVDAFDQPGVEAYKKILGPSLSALKQQAATGQ